MTVSSGQPSNPTLTRNFATFSTRSRRLYEMDEMGNKRGENIRHAVPFVRQITEDGKPKLEVYRPTTNPIFIWTQVGHMQHALEKTYQSFSSSSEINPIKRRFF